MAQDNDGVLDVLRQVGAPLQRSSWQLVGHGQAAERTPATVLPFA